MAQFTTSSPAANAKCTYRLHSSGELVTSKDGQFGTMYTNRTQATRAAAKIVGAEAIHRGRPFYVKLPEPITPAPSVDVLTRHAYTDYGPNTYDRRKDGPRRAFTVYGNRPFCDRCGPLRGRYLRSLDADQYRCKRCDEAR